MICAPFPILSKITWAMPSTLPSEVASSDAKVLSGFGGAGVLEVVKDFRGDTFRAVYTLRYAGAVYVVHVFQKKSKTGRETPRRDIELIEQRFREAEKIARGRKS
jgi:phage-related protein